MAETRFVYDPVAPCLTAPHASRRSLDRLAGKVIGFIDNSKPNFNFLVDDLSELLVSRYGVDDLLGLIEDPPYLPETPTPEGSPSETGMP